MMPMWLLLIVIYFFTSTFETPIRDGEDVGIVKAAGKAVIVTGQRNFPFMVQITTFYKQNKQQLVAKCGGIIIGPNTVLTAGHCLHNKPNPRIIVQAGIVDTRWEANSGQKLQVEGYLKHQKYVHMCDMPDGRCCFGKNDIGILWTKRNFTFGPTIQKAVLNTKQDKLIGTKGWVLGWGLNTAGVQPTMLQKGFMEVLPKQECAKLDSEVFISNDVLCLGPVSKRTKADRGDSGGPFVSDGKVYGVSSITVSKLPCLSRELNLFTSVAKYIPWIKESLFMGPPQKKIKQKPQKM